ncbi:hypothetical protein BZA77DRAFT_322422 [Pyronema omphalodes]|nr:hypothetical protein BZA77DRAFT_322422 [Pyronema omphalodes]
MMFLMFPRPLLFPLSLMFLRFLRNFSYWLYLALIFLMPLVFLRTVSVDCCFCSSYWLCRLFLLLVMLLLAMILILIPLPLPYKPETCNLQPEL